MTKANLKTVQMAWSRKLSVYMDERNAYKRVELYKEVKALEAKIAEMKAC